MASSEWIAERMLAGRVVQRWAGEDAAEFLAMLGLEAPEATPEPTKRCSDCEEFKRQSEFYHRKARPGASEPYCRACSYARTKAWRAAQREAS